MNGILTDIGGVSEVTDGALSEVPAQRAPVQGTPIRGVSRQGAPTQGLPAQEAQELVAELVQAFIDEQECGPGAVAVTDRAGQVLAANSEARTRFGLVPGTGPVGTAALVARAPAGCALHVRAVRRSGTVIGAVIACPVAVADPRSPVPPALSRVVGLHGSQYLLLAPAEIRLAVADGQTIWLCTDRGRLRAAHRGLGRLERRLRAHGFLRVHRHALVNLRRVREVAPSFRGGMVLVLHGTDRETVPVARRRIPEVRRALGLS